MPATTGGAGGAYAGTDPRVLRERPAELLQRLLAFDTTNPPGNEGDCVAFLAGVLEAAGISSRMMAKVQGRPNLVARLPGAGRSEPLLLYGHVDVVTTKGQDWAVPPFAGLVQEGYVWGRGAIDMKGGVAMLVAAFLRAAASGPPPGDIILAVVSDEEAGGDLGARWLVEEHGDLFAGARYALGEFGGFQFHMGGRTFYPIQVAEKQLCWLRATVRGPAGHGARPMRGGSMAHLARLLGRLDRGRLPVHITAPARDMLAGLAGGLPALQGLGVRAMLVPALTDVVLDRLGDRRPLFEPLLRHTVNATIVRGGDKINVVPAEVTVDLDGRLLPGFTPPDLIGEVRALVGPQVELEVIRHDPGPPKADLSMFEKLAGILRELDPGAQPIPYLLSGVTDGRWFARLGIQTYGFLPMTLPPDFKFFEVVHAADERIPVEALEFGTRALELALRRF